MLIVNFFVLRHKCLYFCLFHDYARPPPVYYLIKLITQLIGVYSFYFKILTLKLVCKSLHVKQIIYIKNIMEQKMKNHRTKFKIQIMILL